MASVTAPAMRQAGARLGRARLEEPVEAEAPGLADLGLELVPLPIAQLVHHAQDEAVLLLCASPCRSDHCIYCMEKHAVSERSSHPAHNSEAQLHFRGEMHRSLHC